MKKIFLVFTIVLYSFFTLANNLSPAQLQIVAPLPELNEGTETELTAEQLKSLVAWSFNAYRSLDSLQKNAVDYDVYAREQKFLEGLTQVVLNSRSQPSETIMRFVLNRGLKIYQIIVNETRESQGEDRGLSELKLMILSDTIELGLKYFISEDQLLKKQGFTSEPGEMAKFGKEYSVVLSRWSDVIDDVSAQYQLERLNLGFLQWDLWRDKNREAFGPLIFEINNKLKSLPEVDTTSSGLNLIREIKRFKIRNQIAPKQVEPDPTRWRPVRPPQESRSGVDRDRSRGGMSSSNPWTDSGGSNHEASGNSNRVPRSKDGTKLLLPHERGFGSN